MRFWCLALLVLATGWSMPARGADWYVATNGNNAGGTNWFTAFTNVQEAIDFSTNGDTIYLAGQTFAAMANMNSSAFNWSGRTNMTIRGGYEATNNFALPGAQDPALWPTVLRQVGGGRVIYIDGITNSLFYGVTIKDGYTNYFGSFSSMGMYLTRCCGLTLDACTFTNNAVAGSGSQAGGGLYANTSVFLVTNCLFTKNTGGANNNGSGYGGGLYVASGVMTMVVCRITANTATGAGFMGGAGFGGGLYMGAAATGVVCRTVISRNSANNNLSMGGGIYNNGHLTLLNCLVDHNNASSDHSDGIYLAAGSAGIINCTVADNAGVGILYGGGTYGISNAITWGHSDDLKNFPNDGQNPLTLSNVFYSCIENEDNMGRQGCVSIDPLFADTNYYHLQSIQGCYSNGYFDGGTWTAVLSNSPLIDMGDPAHDFAQELAPNGDRVNMGTYGNTPVASLTDTTTVFTLPAVTNPGATIVGHQTARLNGLVTDTGGQVPQCWFRYWIAGDSSTSTVWAGLQAGSFSLELGDLAQGCAYEFHVIASNQAGAAVSDSKTFTTHPLGDGLYVATNGDNTAGTNWFTAYTNLQDAFDIAASGDTIYMAGHTFSNSPAFQAYSLWTLSSVSNFSLLGNYAATSDAALPGPNDPAQWPTVLKRASGDARILYLSGITNSLIRGVSIQDGRIYQDIAIQGAGMYVTACLDLTLDSCLFTNNVLKAYANGGGLYAVGSTLLLTNCVFVKNSALGTQNGASYGGGLYVASGVMTMVLCRVTGNLVTGAGASAGASDGGGINLQAATTSTIVRSVFSVNTCTANGGGIFNQGRLRLENSLVDHNNSVNNIADGLYLAGPASIVNCTITDNSGVGINVGGGTPAITNSIIWGHSDDLKNFPTDGQFPPTLSNVFYSCIQNEDNLGRQGCVSIEPLFANTNYYHLQSIQGYYSNGYFDGGSWAVALSNSPLIDMGDPDHDFAQELAPNGSRVNMGAYGNTPLASLTDTSIVVILPSVTNVGAAVVGHQTAILKGIVTATGGQTPQCGFRYWIAGDSSTSTVWAGLQAGSFSLGLGGLAQGCAYEFHAIASNSAGAAVSDLKTFTTHPPDDGLYVATNGDNTAGASWSTAYTNLQDAFDIAAPGDTIYLAGHVFSNSPPYQSYSLWTLAGVSNIALLGGYAATSDAALPGPNDPARWPTILKRASGDARILYLAGMTNSLIRGLTIQDGRIYQDISIQGAGVYATACRELILDSCLLTNNVLRAYAGGGGLYAVASTLLLTNCVFAKNSALGTQNGASYGGGLYMASGVMTMVLCRVTGNLVTGAGASAGASDGGGIDLQAATTNTIARSVISGNTCTAYGGGIFNQGRLRLENCVIDHNNSVNNYADGLYLGGPASIVNCTIAENSGVGIRVGGGTTAITNSIAWGNGNDLTGTANLVYCDVQTADDECWTNGVDGCISVDPLFVDSIFFHLQSKRGHYTNGYFDGGGWDLGTNYSPAIDAGDPDSPYGLEPWPNGKRVNMGSYGNTPTADLSPRANATVIFTR